MLDIGHLKLSILGQLLVVFMILSEIGFNYDSPRNLVKQSNVTATWQVEW